MNSIEDISIQTYLKNLEYLKLNHNNLYKKIELFQIAIEGNIIKEKFELRYQDNYFDVYDIKENTFLYNLKIKIFFAQAIIRYQIFDII